MAAGGHGELNVWKVDTLTLRSTLDDTDDASRNADAAVQAIPPPHRWEHLIGDTGLLAELADFFCYEQLTTNSGADPKTLGTLQGKLCCARLHFYCSAGISVST